MPRFSRRGRSQFWFVLTIADTAEPSPTEVNAGTRLDTQLATVNGFTFSNSPIMTPDMASAFTSQIAGEDTAEESSMEFYRLDASDTIKNALDKGTVGYVVIFDEPPAGATPANGDPCEVWPVVVSSNASMYTTDNEAAKYRVVFSVTSPPVLDATVTT